MADKKILEEEMLDDEQLEQVSGGTYEDTAADSLFLCERGLMETWYDIDETWYHVEMSDSSVGANAAVIEGWRKAGITYVINYYSENSYYLDGKQISQMEAYSYVSQRFQPRGM